MMNVYSMTVLIMLLQVPASPETSQRQKTTSLETRAESGDPKSQVQLGTAYAAGDGVAADDTQAVKWFRRAADQGDAAGEYFLGEAYATGRGVPVDYAEALKWLRKSAEQGDAHGQYNLAAMYMQGLGLAKDDAEAAKWMGKAAVQGLAAGQFGLGSMYAHGRGVPQSALEAVKWYRKAGDQGDADALNNLAFLLATSIDVKIRNPEEAILIAQKAVEASNENPTCLDTLATAYYEAGQTNKAAEAERRALALKPEDSSYKTKLEKYLDAVRGKH